MAAYCTKLHRQIATVLITEWGKAADKIQSASYVYIGSDILEKKQKTKGENAVPSRIQPALCFRVGKARSGRHSDQGMLLCPGVDGAWCLPRLACEFAFDCLHHYLDAILQLGQEGGILY